MTACLNLQVYFRLFQSLPGLPGKEAEAGRGGGRKPALHSFLTVTMFHNNHSSS